MTSSWLKNTLIIATLFSFRMLGLFMLIPIFTIYAPALHHATAPLIGIALGAYGLSQGLLQIPFGALSDRLGRKPMITLGLMLLIMGSLLGANTDSIYGMIAARILQGTGAIGSVLIALIADVTPNSARTKAMAVIGISIGLSFALAMVLSPAIADPFGLRGVFYFTAALGVLGIFLVYTALPQSKPLDLNPQSRTSFKTILTNPILLRLDFGIFCQHYVLTATFFCIPWLLRHHMELGHIHQTWQFYLPIMLLSFICMLPLIYFAEQKHQFRPLFLGSIALMGLCQCGLMYVAQHWSLFCTMLFVYFIAFNFLEANLPSLISKHAPENAKGSAMGVYSSSQFLGIFAGGSMAGLMYGMSGAWGVFLANSLLTGGWLFSAWPITANRSNNQ